MDDSVYGWFFFPLSWLVLYFIVRQAVLNALIAHTNLVRKQDAEAAEAADRADL